jgi:DNA-binding CsgD family transcriptional regulator
MTHLGQHADSLGPAGTIPRAPGGSPTVKGSTYESFREVPPQRLITRQTARSGQFCLPVPMRLTTASPGAPPGTREDGVEQATLVRRGIAADLDMAVDDLRLLAEIATGVTTDVAARRLELSARTLRRRLRTICDQLDVNTPIEAVVWAARRQLI